MQFWISKFEKYINKTLILDEDALYELSRLENKIITFEFISSKAKINVVPTRAGISINTSYLKKTDVIIKSTPTDFIKTMLFVKYGNRDAPIDMQVIGDITLAQDFQKIMRNLEIDFEEPLSEWVGDTFAYHIGQFLRKSTRLGYTTVDTLIADISEYLRFEIEMLPDELLVDEFNKEVDLLRNETELVSKRIEKINSFFLKIGIN